MKKQIRGEDVQDISGEQIYEGFLAGVISKDDTLNEMQELKEGVLAVTGAGTKALDKWEKEEGPTRDYPKDVLGVVDALEGQPITLKSSDPTDINTLIKQIKRQAKKSLNADDLNSALDRGWVAIEKK